MLCLEIRDSKMKKGRLSQKNFFLSFAEKNTMKGIIMR